MANAEAIEAAMVALLTPVMAALSIDAVVLPETQDEHEKPTGMGLVTVAYHSSKYDGDPSSLHRQQRTMGGSVVQTQTLDFQVAIETRFLRGDSGKHAIIRAAIKALLGWIPPDCSKMYLVDDCYHGFKDNLWCHVLTFRCAGLAVEVGDPPDPLLSLLTFNQEV